MDYSTLKILANKFWEGECSEVEELKLREYLRWNESIPEEFHSLRDYLNMMNTQDEGLSLDFDEKIMSAIEGNKQPSIIRKLYPLVAAAVVLFGVFFIAQIDNSNTSEIDPEVQESYTEVEDTYDDPEKAYEEVKKALMMVSGNMNTGREYSNKLGKFSIAAEQIQTTEN